MSLRDKILNTEDLQREPVEIEEWGETVYVREMTGAERDEYESGLIANRDLPMGERIKGLRALLVVMCTVDADGKSVFTPDDIEAVAAKNARALDKIVNVASSINALSSDAIEDIAGN